MADLKRCDRCGEVWEPVRVRSLSSQTDPNLATVSYAYGRDTSAYPYADRDPQAKNMELCRPCGVALHKWLHPEGKSDFTEVQQQKMAERLRRNEDARISELARGESDNHG